jgi:hypothetical protein
MDNDKQKWKDVLDKMSGYHAPGDKDLFWKIQLNDLPKYATDRAFDFNDSPISKKITRRFSLVILAIVVVLFLVSLFVIIRQASNKEIIAETNENIALELTNDDLMDKTFENFCLDYHIECDDLYDTDIAQRWNDNRKSYQMTLDAIAQLGASDFLNRQLTYLRLHQTEMVTEIINNI